LKHPDLFAKSAIQHGIFLRHIFETLFEAGRRNDFDSAEGLVEEALAANCRPVDILIGMIAPMLHEIGAAWEYGTLTVQDEHRFTAFSEKVVELVARKLHSAEIALPESSPLDVLLVNATGNIHTLAIRILALWLEDQGRRARIVSVGPAFEELKRSIEVDRPKAVLISIALPEQRKDTAELVAAISSLPRALRPRVLIGGFAIKCGLVEPMPDADLVADISDLNLDWAATVTAEDHHGGERDARLEP